MKLLKIIETFSTRLRVFLAGAVLIICAAVAVTSITWAARNRASGRTVSSIPVERIDTTETSSPIRIQNPASQISLDAEHVTLRATGFEPAEFTRPEGRFLLAIDNMTGMGEMSFRLLLQTGVRLGDFPAKGRFRLRQVVDLPPGQYALVEVNHPDWVCRITISAP